jgi:hypothetical protein
MHHTRPSSRLLRIYCNPTGRERGGGDVEGRRARRARMSFGLEGIARMLTYLVAEDRPPVVSPPSPGLTICRKRWR